MRTQLFTCTVALLMLGAPSASAQRHKLTTINAETDEGKALQEIGQETDAAKRIALMEGFSAKHGSHEATPWVISQLQEAYVKAGDHAKAIAAGERLLKLDPEDLDAAYANLKAGEALKDADAVLRWATATSEIARKTAASAQGADADYAKQINTYTEYSLAATASQETDPAKAMRLAEALEQSNPTSQYMLMVMPKYSAAARQANALPKAIAFGERAYARGQFSEDMLLVMADQALQQKQADKTIQYSEKVIEVMNRPKPEGVPDADWERKKAVTTGLAYWMAGTTLSGQNKYAQADKMLRQALPLVKDNEQLHGTALFHLGLVNYKLAQASKNKAQIADAVAFSKQAAAAKGPLAAQAAKNLKVMQQEFGVR
jgi:tetratricopeptide (TPR) repeat protein